MNKTVIKFFFRFSIIISALFLFSCEPDTPDEEPEISRDKFIGIWTCVESSQLTYDVDIRKSPNDSDEIYLYHFHFLGEDDYARGEVAGYSLTLPQQTMCSGTRTISGNALMSSNKRSISFNYIVESDFSIDTINATYSK